MLKNRLAREVAAATAIKVAIIVAASVLVFGEASRPVVDADLVQRHLISATSPNPSQKVAP